MSKELIRLSDCFMKFDDDVILDHINLYINDKEFLTLLGPSGCGKTTTLRIIGGFQKPTSGDVFFDGVRINDVPPHKRKVNTVFQKYALFTHMNIFENVAFGLRISKVPEAELRERVEEALALVNLAGYGKRSVNSLSGGQQQRVAIARAIVNRPQVLLLDEPLGALDLKLRKDMQIELKRIQQQVGITFVYVTHDQEEALTMSDTVVVMNEGRIQQIGTPQDIYNEPKNAFVADFIGKDRGYRKLSFHAADTETGLRNEPYAELDCSFEQAKEMAIDRWLLVTQNGKAFGWFDTHQPATAITHDNINLGATFHQHGSPLRHLLDAALSSPNHRAVIVDERQIPQGTIHLDQVLDMCKSTRQEGA